MNIGSAPSAIPIPPRWTAAAHQVADHSVDAVRRSRQAAGEKDPARRFELAYRAYNSFDHAVIASKRLPTTWLDGVREAYDGYELARNALTAIIATGAVHNLNLRVGRQEMLAGREEFHRGVDAFARGSASKVDKLRAIDWVQASFRDAAVGAIMVRSTPSKALPLMATLRGVQSLIAAGVEIPSSTVDRVDKLFRESVGEFDRLLGAAENQPVA